MKRVLFERGVNEGFIYDETWRANVHLLWPATPEVLSRYMKKRHGIDHAIEGPFAGRCLEIQDPELTSGGQVIALRAWKWTPTWIAVLAHELDHCTNWILWARGLKCVPESEEAFCYLKEALMRRCLELLSRKQH
jgi:hypothetical protein